MKSIFNAISALFLVAFSSFALANECGEIPVAPSIVEGVTASVDDLVANSEAVKSYIEVADAYLDCTAEYRRTSEYRRLAPEDKEVIENLAGGLLEERNAIGDDFNAEVAAFQEANPQ